VGGLSPPATNTPAPIRHPPDFFRGFWYADGKRSASATVSGDCAPFLMCAPGADGLWDQIDREDPDSPSVHARWGVSARLGSTESAALCTSTRSGSATYRQDIVIVLHRVASMERETLSSLSVAERGRMRRVMADRRARRGHQGRARRRSSKAVRPGRYQPATAHKTGRLTRRALLVARPWT
jgi:hypothetical protein